MAVDGAGVALGIGEVGAGGAGEDAGALVEGVAWETGLAGGGI